MVHKRNGRRHPAIYIGILVYADDICLLAESIDDVQCSLHRLETSAAEIGLTINYNKTKAMHLRQASVRHVHFANDDPVDSCDKFEYLGVPTSNAETFFYLVCPRHGQPRLNSAQSSAQKQITLLKLVSTDQLQNPYCCTDSNVFRRLQHSRTNLTQHTDVFSAVLSGFTSLTAYPTQS